MKRSFDITVVLLAIPFLLVPFVFVVIIVWLDVGFPVFFRQTRLGRGGKKFTMVKFRTMRNVCDKKGNRLNDEVRVTALGRFLRLSSVDEIPELWNVFKGDMSLVGPRPLLPEYEEFYTAEQYRRHEVRPGITGWAQVNGRNNLCWVEKFLLDVWYVENQTFSLDVKILFLTMKNIFNFKEVNACDGGPVKPFNGQDL
jgi:lipopolysaccharide/colanic/teichoic acid biosynthesis glycosyltransferase